MAEIIKNEISRHLEELKTRYQEDPVLAEEYLKAILGTGEQNKAPSGFSRDEYAKVKDENLLRKQIEEYYLPKQLIKAIMERGEIPNKSTESQIGIGFIDIADYSFLSKFLSPNENQIVLNGLYAAFNWVLKRHGGYLNKIEGDSIMFHFGGIIDPVIRDKSEKDATVYIAKELFYTCIEMQRVCFLFNQANDKFLHNYDDEGTYEPIQNAFRIISNMRNNKDLSPAINAYFQIRIRIGANIGEVTVGNFGPDGAKQWDVIGVPVIKAKRMESTSPIGGFRISEELYNILDSNGIVDDFYNRFKKEAYILSSSFKDIAKEELFSFGKVMLKDKKNVEFNTYSVQVNAGLPEKIASQIDLLLEKDNEGIERIITLLQYYRGNRFVIDAVEKNLRKKGIVLRKGRILKIVFPKKFEQMLKKNNEDIKKTNDEISEKYSLFNLFEKLGDYQDLVKKDPLLKETALPFDQYSNYIKMVTARLKFKYKAKTKTANSRVYFYNYVFPLVFENIKTSFLEYQNRIEELTEI